MKYKELIEKVTKELQDPMTGVKMLEYNIFGGDRPQIHWSFMNQFIATCYGFSDSRSFNAWKKVGRRVKKGEKAFYIIKPYTYPDKDDPKGKILHGFGTQAEFGYDQTEGDPLPDYTEVMEKAFVNPDMIKVAEKIGVKVEKGLARHGEGGYYSDGERLIMITSDCTEVLYHELAHAVDFHLNREYEDGKRESLGESKIKEVVAEYSSAILARHYNPESQIEVSKGYIKGWAGKELVNSMDKVFPRVKAIVEFILEAT